MGQRDFNVVKPDGEASMRHNELMAVPTAISLGRNAMEVQTRDGYPIVFIGKAKANQSAFPAIKFEPDLVAEHLSEWGIWLLLFVLASKHHTCENTIDANGGNKVLGWR